MKPSTCRALACVPISLVLLLAFVVAAFAKPIPTTTTLVVTSNGSPVKTVALGTVITLTAKVTSSGAEVTSGQVRICDSVPKDCTDIHLLGTAQLTSAGTASLKVVPGIGTYKYKAIFVATPHGAEDYGTSSSKYEPLSVTGLYPTKTAISASGKAGDYTLTASVAGLVNKPSVVPPAGTVSFVDTSANNQVLATAELGAGNLSLNFGTGQTPATNPFPQSVAVADFNGDGKLDLAIPVYSIFTSLTDVNILLGNGDGTFTAGPTFALTGQNVNNIAVADFNGDGKADLALSYPDSNEVQVLLGNGDGTFTAMSPIYIPQGIFFVAAGELNRDGKPDLIVTNNTVFALTILLGNGDGTFNMVAETPAISDFPVSVVVGDFNRDGIPDVAVAGDGNGEFSYGAVTILLGKGDGTFKPKPKTFAAGQAPASIAAGDFNGDGILDLAVANLYVDTGDPGTVTILVGEGNGSFTNPQSPSVGFLPYSVEVADFNGDGIADLVTANAGDNTASVLLGNGDGTFATAVSVAVGTDPIFAGVGDFNGDGLSDFAAANNSTSSVTVVLTEQTQTTTATVSGIAPTGSGKHLVDASYEGNSTYQGGVSPTVSLTGTVPRTR
jgi:FG-GAP-like repeat/FG-GAP repeat